MDEEVKYDVVIDVLEKHKAILWKMTKSNMDNDMMNIMDDIRLRQIDELEQAIKLWKKPNDSEHKICTMKKDWDTQEQCDAFDLYLADTSDSRTHSVMTGAYGYKEEEWEAFQYGWNAAKKYVIASVSSQSDK